ncbi:unnamed protein product [Mytilus coruscus]|uniref:Uncharacterized protein n=1 Tax=Mytilus coruscus TaxID=42192 RepID=A0A6J8F029_MYTCO|nr:unnamed protein product [Mytilus coruscus]
MDLRKRKKETAEINCLRGKEDQNTISVQMDGMYNNLLYSGVGRTPFQPATQTVYTSAENITTDPNIFSITINNKLCSKHSSLEVDSDSGCLYAECTDECSADISIVKSIRHEHTWAKECILDLKVDNIEVEYLVTDPDSSAYMAAQDLTKLLPVKSDYDTPKYTRLTMKKYNLVVNNPCTDPEEKARRSARAVKLLRPKSDGVSVPKKSRNHAVNNKR